ncbi:MAG: sulfate ABC transporter permease subunit CysW [Pseudomonadota bacterium]
MVRKLLIGLAVFFVGFVVLLPVISIFNRAFADGLGAYWTAVSDPETVFAIRLTIITALIVLPINVVFGIAAAWALARFEFPGRRALLVIIESPFAVSPVVAGLCFLLIYGAYGPVGGVLANYNIQLMFNLTGIVLVSAFITCPFVVREVMPVLMVTGRDEEKAALTLGASGFQMFRLIVLPNISWGLAYGVILSAARAMGEFGAVSVVSGTIRGQTMTLPLQIELLYNNYNATGAFAAATLLTGLALLTLAMRAVVTYFGPRKEAHA